MVWKWQENFISDNILTVSPKRCQLPVTQYGNHMRENYIRNICIFSSGNLRYNETALVLHWNYTCGTMKVHLWYNENTHVVQWNYTWVTMKRTTLVVQCGTMKLHLWYNDWYTDTTLVVHRRNTVSTLTLKLGTRTLHKWCIETTLLVRWHYTCGTLTLH